MAPEALIRIAGRRLAQTATRPVRVVLFGSRALGESSPESDLDLLVIERGLVDRDAEYVRLRRSLRGLGVAVDLILVSEDDSLSATMSTGIRSIIEFAQARPDGLHVHVGRDQLAQIGARAGERVVVSIRRATRGDWIAASSGRIYESTEAMDEAISELRALPA